jgi:hypothetical protein
VDRRKTPAEENEEMIEVRQRERERREREEREREREREMIAVRQRLSFGLRN